MIALRREIRTPASAPNTDPDNPSGDPSTSAPARQRRWAGKCSTCFTSAIAPDVITSMSRGI